jgi:ABC-type sugar transport system substrate-binding protein
MKRSRITLVIAEICLLILVSLFVRKIFEQEVPEKRVAVILPDSGNKRWDTLIRGMKDAADANQIHLIICNTDEIGTVEDEEELIKEQKENNVDGFIICPAPGFQTKQMLIDQCAMAPFILVTEDIYMGEGTEPSGLPVIKPANYEMGFLLGKQMVKDDPDALKGKRIGIASGWLESEQSSDALKGFKDAIKNTDCDIVWEYHRRKAENVCDGISSNEKTDYIAVLDTEFLDEIGEQADESIFSGAKIYGIGSSMKSVALLDYGKIEALVLPDFYDTGYESVRQIANKMNNSFYAMSSIDTNSKLISKEDIFSNDIERFIYSYE